MREVVVYSRPGCHLCEDALAALRSMQGRASFTLREVDITSDDSLHRAYLERIPVIELDGEELCEYFLDEELVLERLESGGYG